MSPPGGAGDHFFLEAFAGSAALVALMPLAGSRAVPAVVRLALALSIAPLGQLQFERTARTGDLLADVFGSAVLGAATGLSASAVAGAAASAGSLIDTALGASPAGAERVFGQSTGPFGMLVPLAFAVAMTGSGALTWLLAGYSAAVGSLAAHFALPHVAALGRAMFAMAVAAALPALCAHALAAFVAGCVARLAPRVNGVLLAPALSALLVLTVLTAGASALFFTVAELSRLAARAALL